MCKHKTYPARNNIKQECIPVGCVPAAHRPYAGVCFPGGGSPSGGGFSIGGGMASQHALRQTPPPCGQTHTCKNMALATTSLRPVITFSMKCGYVCSAILIGRKQQSLLPWELCHGDRDRVGSVIGFVFPVKIIGLAKNNTLQTL